MVKERVYLQHNEQVILGVHYQVTDDFLRLKKFWNESTLGELNDYSLRHYLGKFVIPTEKRAFESMEAGEEKKNPGIVKCLDLKKNTTYFPVQVLSRVSSETGESLSPDGGAAPERQQKGQKKKLEYFTDFKAVKIGMQCRVTNDLDMMKSCWIQNGLDQVGEGYLRKLLRQQVKVEELVPEKNSVSVKLVYSVKDDIYTLPFACLAANEPKKAKASAKPDAPEKKSQGGKDQEEKGPITEFKQIVRNRKYKVSTDVEFLQQKWDEAGLDQYTEVSMFKGVEGRVTDLCEKDNTVKITWKSTYEWFPIFVLTECKNQWANTSSSNRGNANSNGAYNVSFNNSNGLSLNQLANEAAAAGLYREMQNTNGFQQDEGDHYLYDVKEVIVGREYLVTDDLQFLKDYWRNATLPLLDDIDMKSFLNRRVKAVQIDFDDQTVQARFVDTLFDRWFPVQVLQELGRKRDPNSKRNKRQRGEQNQLHVGDIVRLTNVVKEEYQGTRGRLVEYFHHDKTPKWRVYLEDFGKIVRVQQANLGKIGNTMVVDADGNIHTSADADYKGENENPPAEQNNLLTELNDVEVGKKYRVTPDRAYLDRAMQTGNMNVSAEHLQEIAGEIITVRAIDFEKNNVFCLFSSESTEYVPYYCLEKIQEYGPQNAPDGYQSLNQQEGKEGEWMYQP